MGEDDYTRRLHFHVERIIQNEPIGFVNMDAEMGFIQATEAVRFLYWVGMNEVEGPINAAANGTISLKELIALIEDKNEKRAKIVLLGPDEIRSPYAVPASWYMVTNKAQQLAFTFSELQQWLPDLVGSISKSTTK